METMQAYVKRKLNDRAININKMARDLDMNRSKIYRIKNGGETSASALQRLHDYLKSLGD